MKNKNNVTILAKEVQFLAQMIAEHPEQYNLLVPVLKEHVNDLTWEAPKEQPQKTFKKAARKLALPGLSATKEKGLSNFQRIENEFRNSSGSVLEASKLIKKLKLTASNFYYNLNLLMETNVVTKVSLGKYKLTA